MLEFIFQIARMQPAFELLVSRWIYMNLIIGSNGQIRVLEGRVEYRKVLYKPLNYGEAKEWVRHIMYDIEVMFYEIHTHNSFCK